MFTFRSLGSYETAAKEASTQPMYYRASSVEMACPSGQVMTEFGCQTMGGSATTCPPGTTWTGSGCLVTKQDALMVNARLMLPQGEQAAPANLPSQAPTIVVDQPAPGMVVTEQVATPTTFMVFGMPWWKAALGAAVLVGGTLLVARALR